MYLLVIINVYSLHIYYKRILAVFFSMVCSRLQYVLIHSLRCICQPAHLNPTTPGYDHNTDCHEPKDPQPHVAACSSYKLLCC
jgi:hypothetical protein